MTTWDIDVAQVQHVLDSAGRSAQEYDAHLSRVNAAVSEVLAAVTNSPLVTAQVQQLNADMVSPHLRSITDTTAAALHGTAAAVRAYQEGDAEMAERGSAAAEGVK